MLIGRIIHNFDSYFIAILYFFFHFTFLTQVYPIPQIQFPTNSLSFIHIEYILCIIRKPLGPSLRSESNIKTFLCIKSGKKHENILCKNAWLSTEIGRSSLFGVLAANRSLCIHQFLKNQREFLIFYLL